MSKSQTHLLPLSKLVETTYSAKVNCEAFPSLGFYVQVFNSSDKPSEWRVLLRDYDDNIGCVGEFASERDALDHLDDFVELAIPLYLGKHAKQPGQMPIITLEDGKLTTTIPPKPDYSFI